MLLAVTECICFGQVTGLLELLKRKTTLTLDQLSSMVFQIHKQKVIWALPSEASNDATPSRRLQIMLFQMLA